MTPVVRKIILALLAILVTAAVIFLLKPKETVQSESKEQVLKSIKALNVTLATNQGDINIQGKTTALDKIEIFSEANGIMSANKFKEGTRFKKGELLLSINSDELQYSLSAQKSTLLNKVASMIGDLTIDYPSESKVWQAFLDNINIDQPLPDLPTVGNQSLKRFLAGRDIFNTYYSIKATEEKLSKYQIYAPFNGILVQSNIKNGALVRAGQPLGVFMNDTRYELESEVSLSELNHLQTGQKITLKADHASQDWIGTIERINATINPETQLAQVFVSVNGQELKEGIYLYGAIKGEAYDSTFVLDRKLIQERGVYTIVQDTIQFKKVEVLFENESEAIVKGLANEDVLVANNVSGLYVGKPVNVVK
jgi:multidrug efflux pump subunit AcrA (membrane-fusion protein)